MDVNLTPSPRVVPWRGLLAGAVAVWAAAVTAGAAYLAVGLATQDAADAGGARWEAVAAGAVALALWWCAVGAVRGRRWIRGPVLTWLLIGVPVSLTMSRSRLWYVGVVLLACSVVGLVATVRTSAPADD